MNVLVLLAHEGSQSAACARWIGAAFAPVGAVRTLNVAQAVSQATSEGVGITRSASMREVREAMKGNDLIVFVTDEITFVDGGGPLMAQMSSWAALVMVPVVAVAAHVDISTRQLRTVGVEAAYEITSTDDANRLVATWAVSHRT